MVRISLAPDGTVPIYTFLRNQINVGITVVEIRAYPHPFWPQPNFTEAVPMELILGEICLHLPPEEPLSAARQAEMLYCYRSSNLSCCKKGIINWICSTNHSRIYALTDGHLVQVAG